jgi:hypothetical protein
MASLAIENMFRTQQTVLGHLAPALEAAAVLYGWLAP